MPTNQIASRSFSSPKTVLANESKAFRGVTVNPDFVQLDLEGNKVVYPGTFLMPVPGSNQGRVYPFTTLNTDTTAGNVTTVNLANNRYFAVNDVVTVARPFATITLASVWANADTLTLNIGGDQYVHTVAGFVDLPTLATAISASFNSNSVVSRKATAIAAGAVIYLFGKSAETPTIAVVGDGTAGAGTATVNTANLRSDVPVGTISAINTNGTGITFTGNALALPVGAPVAVAVDPNSLYGVVGYEAIIGTTSPLMQINSNDLPCYNDALVYSARCNPPLDKWISDALPNLIPFPLNV